MGKFGWGSFILVDHDNTDGEVFFCFPILHSAAHVGVTATPFGVWLAHDGGGLKAFLCHALRHTLHVPNCKKLPGWGSSRICAVIPSN